MLREIGPMYGYFVNPTKTWLIVKEEDMTPATDLFLNEGIRITRQGRRHLDAALGSRSSTEEYVTSKVADLTKEVEKLATIAACQPHAVSAAFTHSLNLWEMDPSCTNSPRNQ